MPFVSPDSPDKGLRKALKEHGRSVARTTFVSSWYLSEVESAALWRLFPKSDEGIAIKSTVDKLMKSLAEGPEEYSVWITPVTYGHERTRERKAKGAKSYSSDDVVFTKRACFEHEKELRLVIYGHDLAKPIPRSWRGVKVPVNINSLISEVVVGPEAPHTG